MGFLLYTLLFILVSGLLGTIGEIELTLLDLLSRRIPSSRHSRKDAYSTIQEDAVSVRRINTS